MKTARARKTIFVCQGCGYQAPKWMGRCPDCGGWNTLVEETPSAGLTPSAGARCGGPLAMPVSLDSLAATAVSRLSTGIREFDRVLGGGLVPGSLVLVGGDPGIGKSSLMLQALCALASKGSTALYISGEESVEQIKLRSDRLGAGVQNIWVVSETNLERIGELMAGTSPHVMVVDSIQTVYTDALGSVPGSVGQVREATVHLMALAKRSGVPIFVVGHVTKEGAIAGPRLLEHMVDTVLYFEGAQNNLFRILRAVKNRFGSTNEIGVFEMEETGLREVVNPSSVFLPKRASRVPGSVVTASMEGSRPILLEIQGLVCRSSLGTPRRTVLGVDPNRVSLLAAVMEKKLGLHLMNEDVFVNVAGGVRVAEPAVDLAIASAIASSFFDRPVEDATMVLGEVGLTGEIRAISWVEARVMEAAKMGFVRCLLPKDNLRRLKDGHGMTAQGVETLGEAMDLLF